MTVRAVWVLGACVVLWSTGARAEPLGFQVPAGWVDLGPNASKEALAKAPPAVVQAAQGGNFLAYAMDLDHADDGFAENLNVVPTTLPGRLTDDALEQVVGAMAGEIQKQFPGATYKVVEKGLRTINDVTCGRWVAEATMNGTDIKQVIFLMPGETQMGVLTYSTTPKAYAAYLPVFEAAAAKTTGLKEPASAAGGILAGAGSGALRGALIGAVVALILGIVRTRAKKKAA